MQRSVNTIKHVFIYFLKNLTDGTFELVEVKTEKLEKISFVDDKPQNYKVAAFSRVVFINKKIDIPISVIQILL